jgi:polyhydroxyalkanoate synthesis regulator phasin
VNIFLTHLVREGYLLLQEAKRLKDELLHYLRERKSKIKAILLPKKASSSL